MHAFPNLLEDPVFELLTSVTELLLTGYWHWIFQGLYVDGFKPREKGWISSCNLERRARACWKFRRVLSLLKIDSNLLAAKTYSQRNARTRTLPSCVMVPHQF